MAHINAPLFKLRQLAQQELRDSWAYRDLASAVLFEFYRFPLWTGSSSPEVHHYGTGGLCRHTLEVAELCLQSANYYRNHDVDKQLLFLAALYHDVGKMWDYEPDDEANAKELRPYPVAGGWHHWRKAEHKYQIHHIPRSAIYWNEQCAKINAVNEQAGVDRISQEAIDSVTHAILAHHGQKTWGSPVEPRTRMAWLLHCNDQLSARMDDCYRITGREEPACGS